MKAIFSKVIKDNLNASASAKERRKCWIWSHFFKWSL